MFGFYGALGMMASSGNTMSHVTFGSARHQYNETIAGGSGGDGGVRAICFLEPMTASMLGNSRVVPPFGVAGGRSGALASNYVLRTDGRVEPVGHVGRAELDAGDIFVIATPGGGGFGAP